MKKSYSIEHSNYGLLLKNGIEVFAINKVKEPTKLHQFYLKQIAPKNEYITGLFDKKDYFEGKDLKGNKVYINIVGNHATINFVASKS